MKAALVDLLERAGATFAQAFLASITINATGVAQVEALKVAALAGGFAVAKFLLVKANEYLKAREVEFHIHPPAPSSDLPDNVTQLH